MRKVNEELMANHAGNMGYGSAAAATGPVAGFDPILGFKARIRKMLRMPPANAPRPTVTQMPISDNW